jgi:two-component system sensor histidine kinase AlgZ
VAIILLATVFSSAVAIYLLGEGAYTNLDGWWLVRNLLVATLFSGIVLRYFYLQQQLLLREQAELTARIESLRSRIRPHFLFNTMNSIASLIGSRPDEAERLVEDLSDLFRGSLLEGDNPTTLADELHLCKLYLRIEQLRLGDRMSLRWNLDSAALACSCPALLLQPLVENAVYHGVAKLPAGGEIAISATAEDNRIRVVITNPLPEESEDSGGGHRMALDNIRQRLEAQYQDRAAIALRRKGGIFEAVLTIPMESEVRAR